MEMIEKKKEGGDQAIDGRQPIQGQDYRQASTRVGVISCLIPPILGNFIERRR